MSERKKEKRTVVDKEALLDFIGNEVDRINNMEIPPRDELITTHRQETEIRLYGYHGSFLYYAIKENIGNHLMFNADEFITTEEP